MSRAGQLGRFGGLFVLGIAAAEVIIMSSPFAGFFYASFGFRPLLGFLSESPATAWLNGFFLPNTTVTRSRLLELNREIGLLLVAAGLWGFFISAAQVYGNKLLRRGVATGLLYRISRHPQYLSLAVAGWGMVVIWSRFLMLVLWVTMLFLYAALARFEEARMRERFGEEYDDFAASRSSFLPGSPVRRLFEASFGRMRSRPLRWATAYVGCLLLALGLASVLRSYTLRQLHLHWVPDQNSAVLSAWPADGQWMESVFDAARKDPRVHSSFRGIPPAPVLATILPLDYRLTAMLFRKQEGSTQWSRLEGLTQTNLLGILRTFLVPTSGFRWGGKPLLGKRPPLDSGRVQIVFSAVTKPYRQELALEEILDPGVHSRPIVLTNVEPPDGPVLRPDRALAQNPWGGRVAMPMF